MGIEVSTVACRVGIGKGLSGESEYLERLYDEIAPGLFRYASYLLGSQDDAEDIVADVFHRIAGDVNRILRCNDPKAYLYVCIRNAVYGLLRRKRLTCIVMNVLMDQSKQKEQEHLPDTGLLHEALGTLPVNQKEVIVLKIVEGMTFEEIGKLLSISPNTAAARYRYAIDKVRRQIVEAGDE